MEPFHWQCLYLIPWRLKGIEVTVKTFDPTNTSLSTDSLGHQCFSNLAILPQFIFSRSVRRDSFLGFLGSVEVAYCKVD